MYFSNIPKIIYDSENNGNFKGVTNLLRRVKIRAKVKENAVLLDTYDVKNGETPEMIAHKYYGDSQYHWVVLLVNDNVNGVVSGEFTDFHLLDVGILVPVCISALIARHPNVLALVEIAISVVVEDGHGVCSVGRNRQIVVAVAVEIANGEVGRVAMGRV